MPAQDDIREELANLPTMHHPTVSPDGREVALYYDVTGRNELHVLDTETGEVTQWSDGEVPRNTTPETGIRTLVVRFPYYGLSSGLVGSPRELI